MHPAQELVRIIQLTVPTFCRRIRIPQVPPSHTDILSHVLPTRPALWRKESLKLIRGTMRGRLSERRSQKARHKIRKRIDTIHEDPEAGQIIFVSQNAAESVHHNRYQRGVRSCYFFAGRASDE